MDEARQSYVVVGIGEFLWDIYRHGRYVGGTPANFAIHSSQLGDRGVLVSRVGDDGMGRELLAALKQRRLSTEYVQVDKTHVTGNVMVALDVQGVPSFRCSQDVAFDYLEPSEQNHALAASADAVLFSTLGQRSTFSRRAVQRFVRAAGRALKVLDVNVPSVSERFRELILESLPLADVLQTNIAGINALRWVLRRESDAMRRFMDFLIKKFSLKLVAITLGENGCEVFDGASLIRIEGLPVRVVDTIGAGDAFAAGVVHKYLRGAPLQDVAEYANLLGAYVSTQMGATPALSPETLESLKGSLS